MQTRLQMAEREHNIKKNEGHNIIFSHSNRYYNAYRQAFDNQ